MITCCLISAASGVPVSKNNSNNKANKEKANNKQTNQKTNYDRETTTPIKVVN